MSDGPTDEQAQEQAAAEEELEQVLAHAAAAAQQFLIKVMLQPTTASVNKFEDGRRILTMTQQGIEVTIPFGPGEAEQLSQELHVPKVQTATPAEAKAAGLVLP